MFSLAFIDSWWDTKLIKSGKSKTITLIRAGKRKGASETERVSSERK